MQKFNKAKTPKAATFEASKFKSHEGNKFMNNTTGSSGGCPVIADVGITTDAEGRFNLNALHRAHLAANSMLHRNSKQPADWLKLEQTINLIKELSNSEDLHSFTGFNSEHLHSGLLISKSGRYGGTFAHELLAISYAGWISPAFQLKVNQVFLDYRTGKLNQAPALPSAKDLALMVIQAEEEKERLLLVNRELTPKAEFHDSVAVAPDAISLAQAAKTLNTGRNRLCSFMREHGWLTRYNEPYQAKIEAGLLDVKIGHYNHPIDGLKSSITPLVTGKGLSKLHQLLEASRSAA